MVRFKYYVKKRKKGRRIEAHFLHEGDFSCEEKGVVCPNIYVRQEDGKHHYLVELVGVTDKKDVTVNYHPGDILRIEATPSKKVIYRSFSQKIPIEKYQASIEVPLDVEAKHINAHFNKSEELLEITVRKPRKSQEIEVT